jgi:hypothetical protein
MQHDTRFSDSETDEAMRLPSRKVFVALAALALLMLAMAALSSGQVTAPLQRDPVVTNSITIDATTRAARGAEQRIGSF